MIVIQSKSFAVQGLRFLLGLRNEPILADNRNVPFDFLYEWDIIEPEVGRMQEVPD